MIRFGVAEIENFLTIKKCTVDFGKPGLYGVLGPNGAGKSGLFLETLLYPMFGITERFGIQRDKIVSRFVGKDCHIHLPLWVDEVPGVIDAYRKHTKFKDELFFTINGEDKRGRSNAHTWDKIIKFIDMDHVAFTNCAVFGQSVAMLSSLSDSEQKAVIERIVGLSWCPKAYELSGADVKSLQLEQGKLETKLADFYEQDKKMNSDLAEYRAKLVAFEEDKKKRIGELGSKIAKTEDTSEMEQKVTVKQLEIAQAEKRLEGKATLDTIMEKLNTQMAELIATIKIKTAEKQKAKNKIYSLSTIDLKGPVKAFCEFCGQNITEESVSLYSSHLTEHMKALDLELSSMDGFMNKINDEKQPVIKQRDFLKEVEKELKSLNLDLQGFMTRLSAMQIKNAKTEEFNQGLMKRMDEIEKETSPYEGFIKKLEEEFYALNVSRADVKVMFDLKQEEMLYREFLVEFFSNRGFKSFVIESVLPDADRFASIYSKMMGGKYDIRFSPQTTLKGGEVREKFNVEVFNKVGSDVYEGNSNGEKRAIDSVVMFVLGDLAASRLNKRVSLLILDDIFEALDNAVCDYIIQVLRMMVTPREQRDNEYRDLPERESIFVLTHLEEFKESFDNKMEVSRDAQGFTKID